MRKPSKKTRKEFLRFAVVGAVSFLLHNVVYLLLTHLGTNLTLAYSLGFLSWAISNYLLSTFVTFRTRLSFRRAVGYTVSIGIYYLVQLAIFTLLQLTPTPEILITPIVYTIAFPINFVMVRWVMKR